MGFMDRIQRGWNAFRNRDPTQDFRDTGMTYYYRPDRPRFTRGNESTIIVVQHSLIIGRSVKNRLRDTELAVKLIC